MGFITRAVVPRSVRHATHPVRAVKRAATPKAVKQVRHAMHPVSNAVYGVERSLSTKPRKSADEWTIAASGVACDEGANADMRSEADRRRSEFERLNSEAVHKRMEKLQRVIERHRAKAVVNGASVGDGVQWTELRPSRRIAIGHARFAASYERELAKLRAKHPEWAGPGERRA